MSLFGLSIATLFATAVALPSGSWSTPPDSLPDAQLPAVPLTGNGRLGVALDASSRSRNSSVSGPGHTNSIDLWLNTNSLWSCTTCGDVDPDHNVAACCSVAALGGVTIKLPAGVIATTFSASQVLASGIVSASWNTSNGGRLSIESVLRPVPDDFLVVNVTWDHLTDDAVIAFSTWVLGADTAKGTWTTGAPLPARAGCALSSGSEAPCDAASAPFTFVSRNASTINAGVMPVSAALASVAILGPNAALRSNDVTGMDPTRRTPWEVTMRVFIPRGGWAAFIVTEAETRGSGLIDPVPAALAAAVAAVALPPSTAREAAAAWWTAFWSNSSVSLPSRPRIEDMWAGAQYILAASSSTLASETAPGLYGPWATQDGPNWHGDYTLDYNYAAPYYSVFGSNHAEQAAAYWGPILDWMPAARVKAQAQAKLAHVTCPPNALYYACHIAPWGMGSLDPMTRYMSWNGHHAALLFINAFEYTLDADFATTHVLPLLDGLNEWWHCYLNKTTTGPGPDDYVYNDVSTFNGDYEHEGQIVPNPQIALAFVYRTIRAQLSIAATLGLPVPAAAAEINEHLPLLNTATVTVGGANFTLLNNTRCNGDIATWYNVLSTSACERLCAGDPACGLFSYCPPFVPGAPSGGCSGSGGEPAPNTCWGYDAARLPLCTRRPQDAGWESGVRNASNVSATVWTAFRGAAVADSDWFRWAQYADL